MAALEQTLTGSDLIDLNDFQNYIKKWTQSFDELHKFYSSSRRLQLKTYINGMKRQFFDRVFSDVLGMLGLKLHDHMDKNGMKYGIKYVIAVGTGDFKSKYGLPLLHTKCGKHIIHKVISD